ncbi:hypothetical protein WMY93_033728 [Mugilogobius chulae]|uniref:Uncharacterized protein n=1 Tax=Mugilogobius chulae TaxID=88201 RepID=A0AAW0MJU6_9GOBI
MWARSGFRQAQVVLYGKWHVSQSGPDSTKLEWPTCSRPKVFKTNVFLDPKHFQNKPIKVHELIRLWCYDVTVFYRNEVERSGINRTLQILDSASNLGQNTSDLMWTSVGQNTSDLMWTNVGQNTSDLMWTSVGQTPPTSCDQRGKTPLTSCGADRQQQQDAPLQLLKTPPGFHSLEDHR